jgi:hypothetical protein
MDGLAPRKLLNRLKDDESASKTRVCKESKSWHQRCECSEYFHLDVPIGREPEKMAKKQFLGNYFFLSLAKVESASFYLT